VGVAPARQLDLWLALLAGERAWRDEGGEPAAHERGVAAAMLSSLLVVVVMIAAAVAARWVPDGVLSDRERSLLVIAVVGSAAVIVLAVRPAQIVVGRPYEPASVLWSALYRSVGYLAVIAAMAAAMSDVRFLAAIPLGLVAGADMLLAAWALGVEPVPWAWIRRFIWSTLHFGVVGALAATAWWHRHDDIVVRALALYVAMWLGLVVAGGVMSVYVAIAAAGEEQQSEYARDVERRERRRRAHWLHDDILSEIRLATLQISSDDEASVATRRALEELDHRLRLRQLEASISTGDVHLYEILQPHLRRVQNLGVRLVHVPALESTDLEVDETAARLIERSFAGLISNALNAGATTLGIDVETATDGEGVTVSVTDDAGGFDFATIPAGRGLSRLARDLGPGAIARSDAPGGSVVTATVRLRRCGATLADEAGRR